MTVLVRESDRVFGTNSAQQEVFSDAALPIVEGEVVWKLFVVDWCCPDKALKLRLVY
jgi:hypothetical protein